MIRTFFCIILFQLFIVIGYAQIKGKVVKISDGDTFTVLTASNETVKVRLHGIDCPEKSQDFGQVAKQHLSNLIFNRQVKIIKKNVDRYGRVVGVVFADTINVNEHLLSSGLAWHFKKYDTNPVWAKLETNAKSKRLGLWSMSNSVPPWMFRKNKTKSIK
ncbi:thermonuclease family protein [Pseudochryseolinea flava]|uniref:TNase-like domain-containing protein n=1 Tax=Pseudochryseolinea flava TaxID=2059302 RepID=A0A364XXA8_9BACT|nr:thermonuclease family protein [Pseudochryseolinea flava]RAV98921.1 hypothetical protein DQQ10_21725 [Pseudochryseolinea flava]